ncbi:MAG TPA: hypothetical protein VJK02_07950 [Anaerolineales bacterium]|jgi:hypothetical protein|nr:hypothetical protein [Anaerolineales bacterium]
MNKALSFRMVSITLFIALLVSYILCIVGDLLFGWTMYTVWAPLIPGFTWPLSGGGFLIGLLWLVTYSLYLGALLVLPYNYLTRRAAT